MEQFFQFVINHWPLWLLFFFILGAIFYFETKGQLFGVKLITTQQLTELMNHQKAIVIDIREKDAFSEGHILGSLNFPESKYDKNMKKMVKYRSNPVILVCADGYHSTGIGAKLQNEKFEQVFALRGGIRTWQSEDLPLESND